VRTRQAMGPCRHKGKEATVVATAGARSRCVRFVGVEQALGRAYVEHGGEASFFFGFFFFLTTGSTRSPMTGFIP